MIKEFYKQRIQRGLVRRLNNLKIASMAKRVANEEPQPSGAPVVFFKASTGIDDLSWNGGFHLLASWAFRLQGVPVVYFACQAGMSRCVLGTNRNDVHQGPPCKTCIHQSKTLYTDVPTFDPSTPSADQRRRPTTSAAHWFTCARDPSLAQTLTNLTLAQLSLFTHHELPLGRLCLPGLRWILRVHNLPDDENTRY